jgi:hypothetical protein
MLACSTFKPQVAVFPIVCCLLWLLWQRRFRPVAAFAAVIVAFVGIGWLISPSWIIENWHEVMQYPLYNPPGNPESSLRAMWGMAGSYLGIAISITASVWIGFLWFRIRNADVKGFIEALLLTLILAPLSGLQTDAGNQYILLLPIASLLLPSGEESHSSGFRFISILGIIGIGLWVLFLLTVQYSEQPVQHPVMLFPLPVFLLGLWFWDQVRSRRPLPVRT